MNAWSIRAFTPVFDGLRRFAPLSTLRLLDYLSGFPTAVEDFALVKSFLRIKSAKMRRCILALVQAVMEDER